MRYIQGSGYDPMVRAALLRDPLVIYTRDAAGQTWLHKYAGLGEYGCLCLILTTDIENCLRQERQRSHYVHSRDRESRTALHYAAMRGVPACIRLLLENDANTEIEDCEGRQPCDLIAKRYGIYLSGLPGNIEACKHLLLPHELA